jgi:hypothetical protein
MNRLELEKAANRHCDEAAKRSKRSLWDLAAGVLALGAAAKSGGGVELHVVEAIIGVGMLGKLAILDAPAMVRETREMFRFDDEIERQRQEFNNPSAILPEQVSAQ